MMNGLVDLLHHGNYSLVIRTATGEVRTFTRRGVADLHELYHDTMRPLRGALVADKVTGLGAAALMAAGGVASCHTDVISTGALQLLRDAGVECGYGIEVPEIINRAGTGRCPLETRIAPLDGDIAAMLPEIDRFVAEMAALPVNS